MGVDPAKLKASLLREMEAVYAQGMFTNGLSTIQTDELHSYEEGINVLGQAMMLDYGGPTHIERAMETAAATERVTGVNAAGHRHIRSSYFSGTTIATGRRVGLVEAVVCTSSCIRASRSSSSTDRRA